MSESTSTDRQTILWADDDQFEIARLAQSLDDEGFMVLRATDATEALRILESDPDTIDLAILDVAMEPGEDFDVIDTHAGWESGLRLAQRIRREHPNVLVIGYSGQLSVEVSSWFEKFGHGYVSKRTKPWEIVERVRRLLRPEASPKRQARAFIVHGHDDETKLEVKNYLQNRLGFDEPIILHERPSGGRTIMEKFEEETEYVNLVFVLLTPDDHGSSPGDLSADKRRARQNVIFEMGYFLGKMPRKQGKVILLHKGDVELPSDISGLIYIDITDGVEATGESIRRELEFLV